MMPVFSVVGSKSGVGKTTIICKIIKELKKRGYKTGTIKHHHRGDFEMDKPGKDTWKHAQAGSDVVVISSEVKIAKIEKLEAEYKLDDIVKDIKNVDIIITEGYGEENKPKLEVVRKEISGDLHSKEEELFCIVTDFPFQNKIPQFDFNEIEKIVDLIEEKFLK